MADDPTMMPQPRSKHDINASRDGYVSTLAARPIGHATMLLGAGRARVDSTIDPAVGVILHKKVGDAVKQGEPLCTLMVNDERALDAAKTMIRDAFTIGDERVTVPDLIVERI